MKPVSTLILVLIALIVKGQIPNTLSPAEKVLGLSKIWQETNYNFVYINKIDRTKWDSAYLKLISDVQNTKNDYEYYRNLEKFCALLKDGHSNVFLPSSIDSLIMQTMFGPYRLFLRNIDGKSIITRVNLSKKDEIPIGSEITEVNGEPVKEYIKNNVAPYISSSTDYMLKDLSVSKLLEGLSGKTYTLKIKKPDGSDMELTVTHAKTTEKEVYPPFEDRKLLEFRWYDNKIAYIALNSFADPKIDTLFTNLLPELRKAKGIVIDIRNNGGGSTDIGTNILKYLTRNRILYGEKSSTRQTISAYKAWGEGVSPADTAKNDWDKKVYLSFHDNYFYNFGYPRELTWVNSKRIVVPTAILIGHNTFSAAEDFLIYADKSKNMIRIGENSAGSTGQPYFFKLPGGGGARVCTKKDTYPDGREFVGYGVKPDIEVKLTVNDFIQNKDPVLAKALEYLNTKIK